MLDYKVMHKLVIDDSYVFINENTQEVIFSTENDTWYALNGEPYRVYFTENHLTMPVGENLFNFLFINKSDLKLIRTLVKKHPTWYKYRDNHIMDETERFFASLDCAYLYTLFFSNFRGCLVNECTQQLDRMQTEFEFCLNFCCNDGFIPELSSMSAQNRYYVYSQLYTDNKNTCDRLVFRGSSLLTEPNKQFDVLNRLPRMGANNEKYIAIVNNDEPVTDKPAFPSGFSSSLEDLQAVPIFRYSYDRLAPYLMEELFLLIKSDSRVKKCKICGKYFIMKGDYSTDCCDRILDGQKFTCKKIAAIQARKNKLNTSPVLKEYEKFYKRIYARRTNKKITSEDFFLKTAQASKERDDIIRKYGSNPPDDVIAEFKRFLGNR